MIEMKDADYAWEQTAALLAIDSPSGYTHKAAQWVKETCENLGFAAHITVKGGAIIDLGGQDENDFLKKASERLNVRTGGYDCTMYGGLCGAGMDNYFYANGSYCNT